jgi:hypothetical protein
MFERTLMRTCAAALLSASLLTGCVVTPLAPVAAADYAGATITVAPPPPPVEYVGAAPGAGYVWIAGYWNWVGGRHV